MKFETVKQADTGRVESREDRVAMRQVDVEATNRLHAQRLEWHLAMIRCALDPLDMVRILTDLCDPLPPIYLRTAHDEIMRRRAAHQRRDDTLRRLSQPYADADAPVQH